MAEKERNFITYDNMLRTLEKVHAVPMSIILSTRSEIEKCVYQT